MSDPAFRYQVVGAPGARGVDAGWENGRSAGLGQVSGLTHAGYSEGTGHGGSNSQAVPSPKTVPQGRPRKAAPAHTTLADRDFIRRTVQRAVEHADEMIRAAEVAEPIDLSNAGFDLWRCLKDLWGMRQHREPNWGDLLNHLQGALADEKYEAFEPLRCRLIRRTIADHLKPWTVEDEDVRSAIDLIGRAGLDPWKGISAP